MSSTDHAAASGKKSSASRRVKRHPIETKFHVNGRPFDTPAEAKLWADVLHNAELYVSKQRADLSEKRAESLALEIAEASFVFANSHGLVAGADDDSSEEFSAGTTHAEHTNGAASGTDSAHAADL